jgi:hypothetical protein
MKLPGFNPYGAMIAWHQDQAAADGGGVQMPARSPPAQR